ncbi:MAG TPA: polysaccharide biosynthesis/export family protein [Opitutaceae bacterium]|nr:polysaccharide biosynthesis/export family protein [Opitutaceae bacterium]
MPPSVRTHFALLFALLIGVFAGGCSGVSNQNGSNPKIPEVVGAGGLRPGDSLIIAIQGVPDPTSNNVQIDEQGLITLPFVGAIHASGQTTAALSQRIRDTYIAKKIYTALDVSVTVTERYVYVGGEVVRPGRVVWTPDLTLTKAVQAAGGFTLYAKETRVSLVRDRAAYDINVPLAQQKPAEDPHLLPGDAIQVPKSAF